MSETAEPLGGVPLEPDHLVDARDSRCPMPLLKTKLALNKMASGQHLLVLASDAGSVRDIPAYLGHTSHDLVWRDERGDTFRFLIRRG